MPVGRNTPCPCGSGRKYKKCCKGLKDWDQIQRSGTDMRHASLRGKNIAFLNHLCGVLGFDTLPRDGGWSTIKESLTPAKVREVHEGVADIWPDQEDLTRVLKDQRKKVAGLFIGQMDPASVLHAVKRNSLYVDHLMVPDPFLHPAIARPEYNPLEKPERYGSATLKASWLWIHLAPWVEAGLVTVVRMPTDFDPALFHRCYQQEIVRHKNPEVQAVRKRELEVLVDEDPQLRAFQEALFLSMPTDELVARLESESGIDPDRLRAHIEKARGEHPFYLDPRSWWEKAGRPETSSEIHAFSSGASYEAGKVLASVSGAFLVTDLDTRWKEMELDAGGAPEQDDDWSPFAKAMANASLQCLENVTLSAALTLRKQHRLDRMRSFLRRAWLTARGDAPFSRRVAEGLALELDEQIRTAEKEWKQIDRQLTKWFGAEMAGLLAVTPAHPLWLAGGAVAGAATVGVSIAQHADISRSPAGFFLRKLKG